MQVSVLLLGLGCICSVASGALTPFILINAGSEASFEDTDGNIWGPDIIDDGRTQGDEPFAQITGTEDDGLYRLFRDKLSTQGSLIYDIEVPDGEYAVELHFADLVRVRAGQRIFDVLINDETVLAEYDVIAETGSDYAADVQLFHPVVVDDGMISIEFAPVDGHAMVSAIGIYTGTPPTESPTWSPADPDDYQPLVINVEAYPPHKAQGFIGWPGGTIWCQGRPTYWWIGHDNRPEEPFCEEADGTWTKSSTAKLDRQDELNIVDGPTYLDRHDCTAFDANADGVEDLVCIVGANKGTGYGYNDVYYTNPVNGTIERQMQDVGLYKYPTMRTRLIQNVTAADGGNMVMITTTGGPRVDGQENHHRMFRLNETNLFDEVFGPWIIETEVVCLSVCDINNDGLDDFVTCDLHGPGKGYVQNADNSWTELDWSSFDADLMDGWNGAKVADVTGDGLSDLIVAGPGYAWLGINPDPYVRVFPGKAGLAHVFDFDNPVVDDTLPYETMDVETIDLNGDGLLDIYVVQWDHRSGRGDYCQQTWNFRDWWDEDLGHDFPPADFEPPGDPAPDYLYLSRDGTQWDVITMEHSIPGCGYKAKKWSDNSLAVSHGAFGRPGHNVILEWPAVAAPDSPTLSPTTVPTSSPTLSPTSVPTSSPTTSPTTVPTSSPTFAPSFGPTPTPTGRGSMAPTPRLTSAPTRLPTLSPTTAVPTAVPTTSLPTTPSVAPVGPVKYTGPICRILCPGFFCPRLCENRIA